MVAGARDRAVTTDDDETISITLSLGIATYDSQSAFSNAKDLLAAADEALYHSKRNGRNQHTCYDAIKAA